jgi:AraC-like DNA-binding protein/mannose-6-phosphate isomerase-like protein (cupin superfamily)
MSFMDKKPIKIKVTERIQFEVKDYIRLELIGLLVSPPSWIGDFHQHPFWELVYIIKGRGLMKYRGKDQPYERDDVLVLEPNQAHRMHNSKSEDLEVIYIGFSLSHRSYKVDTIEVPCLLKPSPVGEMIRNSLYKISLHLRKAKKDDSLHLNLEEVFNILIMIISTLPLEDERFSSLSMRRYKIIAEKAQRYLESNIDRQVSNHEIANFLYLSPHYFGDIFKRIVGITPKKYHNNLRMIYALKLLTGFDNVLNVSEIAEKLGYKSVHYFSKSFKKYYGVPPSTFCKTRF